MTESLLTPHTTEWLRRRGLEPVLEPMLPCVVDGEVRRRCVDVVGWNSARIIIVELKRALNADAIGQALSCHLAADEAWVCCWKASPQMVETAHGAGVGVLIASDEGPPIHACECTIRLTEKCHEHEWRDLLGRARVHESAGNPHGPGDHAAERRELIEYFTRNPKDGWRLAYRAVSSTVGKRKAVELRARHGKAVEQALGRKVRL